MIMDRLLLSYEEPRRRELIKARLDMLEHDYAGLIGMSISGSSLYNTRDVALCKKVPHTNLFCSDTRAQVKCASVYDALCSVTDAYPGDHVMVIMPVTCERVGEDFLAGVDSVELDVCHDSITYPIMKGFTELFSVSGFRYLLHARNILFLTENSEVCVDVLVVPRLPSDTYAESLFYKILKVARTWRVDTLVFDPFDWGVPATNPEALVACIRKALQDAETGFSRVCCAVKNPALLELARREFSKM